MTPACSAETRWLEVEAVDDAPRLDRFLADRLTAVSRSRIQQLVRDNHVTVNGRAARPSTRLQSGDRVVVDLPPSAPDTVVAPSAAVVLDILYADDDLIVLDKPAGLVVHPAAGHADDTLVNALVARFPDLLDAFDGPRPGLVHRLDRETSGVMVVARRPAAAEALQRQFSGRSVEKVYVLLAKGPVTPPEGVIDAPIGRDPRRRQRMAALPTGRPAQTGYRVLAVSGDYSWVEARPRTGRTHQIRVHFAAVGHPVAGDVLYGHRDRLVGRMALHAWRLAFDHPADGRRVTFEAPLPEDLLTALAGLGISA